MWNCSGWRYRLVIGRRTLCMFECRKRVAARQAPAALSPNEFCIPHAFIHAGSGLRLVPLPNPKPSTPPKAQAWVDPIVPPLLTQSLLDEVFSFPKGTKRRGCSLKSFTYSKLCVPQASSCLPSSAHWPGGASSSAQSGSVGRRLGLLEGEGQGQAGQRCWAGGGELLDGAVRVAVPG